MSDSKFLTGLVLGAIGGILLAPASGKETREKISEATADIRADLQKKIAAIKKEYENKGELTFEGVKKALLNDDASLPENISELEERIKLKYEALEKEIQEMIELYKKNNSLIE